MFKKIPQDQVTSRIFKVYKKITLTQDDVTVFNVQDQEGFYDEDTDAKSNGFSQRALYNSLVHKYYNSDLSLFQSFNGFTTNQNYTSAPPSTMKVISFPSIFVGEAIADGSFLLEDSGSGLTVVDSGEDIVKNTPEYNFTSFNLETGVMVLDNEDGDELIVTTIDLESGEMEVSYNGVTESPNPILLSLDFNASGSGGVIEFDESLSILDDVQDIGKSYGNLFPQEGNLIMNPTVAGDGVLDNFKIEFKSTKTLSETEVLCEIKPGEFNTSTNPTAVDYKNVSSYEFETTEFDSRGNRRVEKIVDFTPRKKQHIYSSYANATGSFDDYYNSSSLDPTGSYLTTYVTSVGLYDDNSELVAIAKMARPIKLVPDHPINFLIRLDT